MPSSPASLSSCATSGAPSGTPSRSAILAANTAPLTRHADLVDTGEPLQLFQLANMPVDLGLVVRERQEARDVEGEDEVPCVGLARIVGIEVDHVAAEHRAIERAGDQPQHHGKP